ncbi:uncharacterized protein LOC129731972 [Wyeomyia smithii]|uniref:uncharacterized protein LOC129731972 n=1 Tax=Wyeomyia smithii TaxID=174621 RepID=UPI002467D6AA|nr:uncharacterized protein LOC129731972 [Wyeomyia smithii]
MAEIRCNVHNRHASTNTVYHCLYGFYFLGLSKVQLAQKYGKSDVKIGNWIRRYEENGFFTRKERALVYLRFSAVQRRWIVDLYKCNLEAKQRFQITFSVTISTASICRILHAEGFTFKALERRAIQLRESDVVRFANELFLIKWDLHMLLFLDEVSCDNKGILRNKRYGQVGKRLIFRGEFNRCPRVSMLSFMGQTGLIETFYTEGTFKRIRFFNCCRSLICSGLIQRYPGQHSVWILDGARIHCHRAIVEYLRSLGIYVVFLPAYAPFFNPIEFLFGYLKRYLKRTYIELHTKNLMVAIAEAIQKFKNFDSTNVFKKCGYQAGGMFDPRLGLAQDTTHFGFRDDC